MLYIGCCLLEKKFRVGHFLLTLGVYVGMSECTEDPLTGDISQLSDISKGNQEDSFSVKVGYFKSFHDL